MTKEELQRRALRFNTIVKRLDAAAPRLPRQAEKLARFARMVAFDGYVSTAVLTTTLPPGKEALVVIENAARFDEVEGSDVVELLELIADWAEARSIGESG